MVNFRIIWTSQIGKRSRDLEIPPTNTPDRKQYKETELDYERTHTD